MNVLLKQSVQKLGDRGDIVNVKDGYARNFLFPQGLAEVATDAIVREAEERQKQREAEQAERRAAIEAMLKKLNGTSVTIVAPTDDDGTLYAAIAEEDVAQALQKKEFEVPADAIVFDEPLKRVGEHTVTLDFGENVTTTIQVVIEQQRDA